MQSNSPMRGSCTFRQRDLVRALKGTKAAGVEVVSIEIDATGKITLTMGKASECQISTPDCNEWDANDGDHQAAIR
jgi:hypothetical protein